MSTKAIRVRFAPSPTGPLHIGGVRTALYNYLFAKKHGGDFILRIEDTDQGRFVPGAEEYIIESLRWCGIDFNEGVGVGGTHAPYRQSERKEMYRQYADILLEKGCAYYAFDTAEELDAVRKQFEAEKKTFQYTTETRKQLKNSFTLDADTTKAMLLSGQAYVIRICIPENETILVNDLIRGEVHFQSSLLDDKVLFKSDGMPTYHLANVVDDHLMEISHVIRGEEWLPSAPLHVLLYRFLGWEETMPHFAHLPLILKPEGNGKLSKRDGDRMGFPVFPLQWTDPFTGDISSGYREGGYLPDAFINMLVFLGWNPGTEQELFTMQELIDVFTIERIGKSGAKFDPEKARWFNHQYIQHADLSILSDRLTEILKEKHIEVPNDTVIKICEMMKERIHLLTEIWDKTNFFFLAPETFDAKSVKDKWKTGANDVLKELLPFIHSLANCNAEELKEKLHDYIMEHQLNMGLVMNAIRISLVGSSSGPDLATIIHLIGVEESCRRIEKAVQEITT